MNRQWLKFVSTFAVILLTSTPVWAGSSRLATYLPRLDAPAEASSCEDPKAELATQAEALGYSLNNEEIVTFSASGITAVVTSIAGFENVPASGYIEGADMGFMYLDAPGSNIPTGYYRLNTQASADEIHVGDYGGKVRLIDAEGTIVASLHANIHTWSLSVPDELPFPRTTVGAMWYPDLNTPKWRTRKLVLIFDCPNGTRTVLEIYTTVPL